MKHLRWLKWTLAAVLVAGTLRAAEIIDLDTTDANNTGTAANAGFPEGMAPSDVNNASRALEGILSRWHGDWSGEIIAYGTGNVIRITPNRTISALTDGLTFGFEATANNTGAVTFRVGTLGAITLSKTHDTPLISGDLESGQKVVIVYNADEDRFQMLSQTALASGFADPMTTRGDSIIRDTGNATARLAVGTGDQVMVSDGTDPSWGSITTANLAAGIDGELWTWDSSGVATQVTAGLAGQVLTSQGAASEPRFVNVISGLEFISSVAFSATTTIVVTGLAAGYDYIVALEAFAPTDDGQVLWMRWSDDGGTTYELDSTDYQWAGTRQTTAVTDESDSEIQLSLDNTLGNDANLVNTLEVTLINPNASSEQTTTMWEGHFMDTNATPAMQHVDGSARFIQGTSAVDAVQFRWSGGSTFKAQGDITVWRRKRS